MVIAADDTAAARRDTDRTMTATLSETFVLHVDAAPEDVRAAMERLGLGHRRERVVEGVELVWDVRAEADDDESAFLSSTRRFVIADDAARERLLSRWSVLGPAFATTARHALRTIKRAAEANVSAAPGALRLAA
jgi:hypothetical protein